MNKKYRNINGLDALAGPVNIPGTDFRAETIAAELAARGYNPEQIRIIRNGDARRGYASDIEKIRLEFSERDAKDYLYIETNREGIYDILPEGIFHQPVHRKPNRDKEEELDEIRVNREREFFARRFFRLFETEIDYVLTLACLYEIKFDRKVTHGSFTGIFFPFWSLLRLLGAEQAVVFIHTIPILHSVKDNFDEIEKSLSLILDVPVAVRKVVAPAKAEGAESRLGKCTLGTDFVLGNAFGDGEYDIKAVIGPVSAKEAERFLKTDAGKITLDNLLRIFLPGDTLVEKEFKISPEDAVFVLSDENTNTYLGINTFI